MSSVLTPRQIELLQLTAEGLRFREIAQRCYVEPVTVRDTLDEVRSRLGAKTLAQAVAIAIALEIIRLPELKALPDAA